jgi:hypothetical protein
MFAKLFYVTKMLWHNFCEKNFGQNYFVGQIESPFSVLFRDKKLI